MSGLTLKKNELVHLAANGSVAHLSDLCSYILQHKDYDINICAGMIHLLDPSHVPTLAASTSTPSDSESPSNVVEHVITLLSSICQGVTKSNDSLKASAAGFFMKYHSVVFQRLHALVKEGKLIGTVGSLMLNITSLRTDLKTEIMTSESDVGLILAAWMREDVNGRYVVVTDCSICPLLDLLQKVVQHELGKVLLWDTLRASPSRVKQLARTTIARIVDIAERYSLSQLASPFALTYLRVLLDIISQLLEEQSYWEPFFRSGDFLSLLSRALLTITRSQVSDNAREDLVKCLRHIVTFCLDGGMGTINPVFQVCNALKGGAITLFCQCLAKFPISHPGFSLALHVMGDFCAYTIYSPVVSRHISAQKQSMSASMVQSLSRLSMEFSMLMPTIDATVFLTTVIHEVDGGRRTGARICDNLDHRPSNHVAPDNNLAKQCSRCRAVFYCSTECQKIDWEEFHRSECEAETSRYIQQKSQGLSLSALMRFQLFAYIEAFCKRHLPVFKSIRQSKGIILPLHSLVIFVDHISIPPGIDIVTHSVYNEGLRNGRLVHYERRAGQYLSRSLQRPEIYLTEMLFPYGSSTVWVFGRVQRDRNDTFRVLSAMTRMITVDKKVDCIGKTARQLRDYQAGNLFSVE